MNHFARLFAELDATTSTDAKIAALKRYFAAANPRDAAWAVYFLAGGKPRQVVPTAVLVALACQRAGIDAWLFDACYQAVGDFAETVAHVLPPPERQSDLGLADWMETRLLPLRGADPDVQAERIASWWNELDTAGRFLLNKLIGGAFRVGVSKLLVQRALAEGAGIDAKLVARRMMGYTDGTVTPSAERYRTLPRTPTSARRTWASPIPSSLRTSSTFHSPTSRPNSARLRIGAWNGSTTGYARNRQAGRPCLDLVARRGTGHRSIPGSRRERHATARWHGAGWRSGRVERRQGRAVQPAAAANRAQGADQGGARRRTGCFHRL